MEVPSLNSPHTPVRASSEGPTPPPRSSMEDGDSSVTRKRPRLDSGERAYRSISADPSSSVLPTSDSSYVPFTSDDKQQDSDTVMADQPNTSTTQPQATTPSKVTINIREQNLAKQAQSVAEEALGLQDGQETEQTPEITHTFSLEDAPLDTVPRTPSPLGSPEIEVAEPEDGDGYSGPTNWMPLGAIRKRPEQAQTELIHDFPGLRAARDYTLCFTRLNSMLYQGDIANGDLLMEISSWFKTWLELVNNHPSSLFELWTNSLDFWSELPSALDGLVKRPSSAPTSDIFLTPWNIEDGLHSHNLISLLTSLSSVVARFIQMDHQTLVETKDDTGVEPDLAAKAWISLLSELVHTGEMKGLAPLWRTLLDLDWDTHLLLTTVVRGFISPPNDGFGNLVSCVLHILKRNPIDWDYIHVCLRCIATVLEHGLLLDPLDNDHNKTITTRSLEVFAAYDKTLQDMIAQQSSSLTVDVLRFTICDMTEILAPLYAVESGAAKLETPQGYETQLATVALTEGNENRVRAQLIANAWKLDVLNKCITSGRMESRITGVDIMSNTFLGLHSNYIKDKSEGHRHVLPQHGADFILDKKVVDYLVGVDSHPQLIQRCRNIVGFLCVTNRYGKSETDVIWSSMLSSQDPRRYDAIIEMLFTIGEVADAQTLHYFCNKLAELPIRDWDARVCTLTKMIMNGWSTRLPGSFNGADFAQLWIRVLRESPNDESFSWKRKKELWIWACAEFRRSIGLPLERNALKQILGQCLKDISESNAASTGSMTALSFLLDRQLTFETIDQELDSHDTFAALLTRDLSRLYQQQEISGIDVNEFSEVLSSRAFLAQRYLHSPGASLISELSESLWDSLVGSNAVNDRARDQGWIILADMAHNSHLRNPFLDKCAVDFLPRLDPQCMTSSILEFANRLSFYQDRIAEADQDQDQADQPLPGDIFWQIALNAPSQETASRSTSAFVESNIMLLPKYPRGNVAELHAKVVNMCVRQLIQASVELKRLNDGSTSSDEESMVMVASDKDLSAARLRFARSLTALKMLMQRVKDSHSASPRTGTRSSPSLHSIEGEEVVFQYQPHSSGKSQGSFQLKIGNLSKLRDLVFRLSKATGFAEFQLFGGGQRIEQERDAEISICDIMALGCKSLLIVKKPGTTSRKGTGFTASLSPLEDQVMKHFQELYSLLDMNDDLGFEVYDFLVDFPPQENIVEKASDAGQACASVFPLDLPWKMLYSIYALKTSLLQRLQEGASCNDLLQCTVQKIGESIIKFEQSSKEGLSSIESRQLDALTECLLQYLREAVPESVSSTYFPQPSKLVECLLNLLRTVRKSAPYLESGKIMHQCFAICLEASLHNQTAWNSFRGHDSIHDVLEDVWLGCPHAIVREFSAQTVKGIIAASPSVQLIESGEFVEFIWSHIVDMIPNAPHHKLRAKQFFDVAVTVFRGIQNESTQVLPLNDYIETWSKTLLEYEHEEFVGRWSTDAVVDGLAELLQFAVQLLKARKIPLEGNEDLMTKIFKAHIFPSIEARMLLEGQGTSVPVLEASVRKRLYQLLHSLCNNLPTFHALIKNLKQLLFHGHDSVNAWTLGFAQIKQDEYYDHAWNIDRNKAIRSPTGYAGLKNLSNTCYLNSLFMQLFMNVTFRDFILRTEVSQPHVEQKLLYESKQLFAYLQETWLKAVDPSNVVDSVITYDGEPIDIHVQMDVDEFYNLLFDRLESQISSADAKIKFRSIYGGTLVQQIKSQDCPHVSERFEPFSVIQCEIQGKSTLAESLSAFIEGEMMQGDNKYKCSTCDSYVNAVKRACLKDVPDNLIFHLKRFDFDLLTGIRSKINDYFEFPLEIDMAPYKIDYVKDPQQIPAPDRFMLVGILVHSGNAEAGHYYSYIRERSGTRNSWVEMNDVDVTPYDLVHKLHESCFGGIDPTYPHQFARSWNAYMLFYQRIDSVKVEEQSFPVDNLPVRAPIPLEIFGRIRFENENWIRKFCLLDPEYSIFCRDLFEQYRHLSKNQCTEDHKLERDFIQMVLHHTEFVFARQKDCEQIEKILTALEHLVTRCANCSRHFLFWMLRHDNTFRNLTLRCPDERVKRKVGGMLIGVLSALKQSEPQMYSTDLDDSESLSPPRQILPIGGMFEETLTEMHNQLDNLHTTKSWDEYFGTLCSLASLGRGERRKIHNRGFLEITLQILFVTGQPQILNEWHLPMHYLRLRQKRKFSLRKLTALATILLQGMNEAHRFLAREDGREDRAGFYTLTPFEHNLVKHLSPVPPSRNSIANTILFGALRSEGIEPRVCQELVVALVDYADGDPDILRGILGAITAGIYAEPAANAVPYLQAGIKFCQMCPEYKMVLQLISRYAEGVSTIQDSGGAEHLDFFAQVSRMSNPNLQRKRNTVFKEMILRKLPCFAPHLMFYHDQEVRHNTVRLIKNLMLDVDYGAIDDDLMEELVQDSGRNLARQCIELAKNLIARAKPLESLRVEDLCSATKECLVRFFDENDEERERLAQELEKCQDDLLPLTVSTPDDGLSGMDGSDEGFSDSESGLIFISD